MKKKHFIIIILISMSISLSACNSNNTNEVTELKAELEQVTQERDEYKAQLNDLGGSTEVEDTDSAVAAATGNANIQIGETVTVMTEYGQFELIVDNVRECDWLEQSGEDTEELKVILLECDIHNIDYEDPYNEHLALSRYLVVLDQDQYVVEKRSSAYEDGEYSFVTKIPPNTNGKIVVPYTVRKDITQITINVNEEYTLTTAISVE